ncbi:hypothetical protein JZU71_04895, partial [bacterium]|nr:hypothetical protein [bacterium]
MTLDEFNAKTARKHAEDISFVYVAAHGSANMKEVVERMHRRFTLTEADLEMRGAIDTASSDFIDLAITLQEVGNDCLLIDASSIENYSVTEYARKRETID